MLRHLPENSCWKQQDVRGQNNKKVIGVQILDQQSARPIQENEGSYIIESPQGRTVHQNTP